MGEAPFTPMSRAAWASGRGPRDTLQPQVPHVSGPAWVAVSRSPAGTFPSQLCRLWLTPPVSGHPRHCPPGPRGAGPEQGPPAWPEVAPELGTLRGGMDAQVRTHLWGCGRGPPLSPCGGRPHSVLRPRSGSAAAVSGPRWLGPDSGLRPAGSEPGRCEQDPGEAPRQVVGTGPFQPFLPS